MATAAEEKQKLRDWEAYKENIRNATQVDITMPETEKLRQKASAVTGMEVHYLYEQTALLEEMQKARQGTCISS